MGLHRDASAVVDRVDSSSWLDFLWLELTDQCNLECVHCYADAGPRARRPDALSVSDYRRLLEQAAALGCRRVQFIGGEPTLFRGLIELIEAARGCGFELIEVYTNALHLSDEQLETFVKHSVAVALSFYSSDPQIHDAITGRAGSQAATIRNIRRLHAAGVAMRAGIIVMDTNAGCVEPTIRLLHGLGIASVGTDRVRGIGRGVTASDSAPPDAMQELCGTCWQGSVCIGPTGSAFPCIMSKQWPIGSVRAGDLGQVVASAELRHVRSAIRTEVWAPRQSSDAPPDMACAPDDCVPGCTPRCSPNCSPCFPNKSGQCNPELFCGPCRPS